MVVRKARLSTAGLGAGEEGEAEGVAEFEGAVDADVALDTSAVGHAVGDTGPHGEAEDRPAFLLAGALKEQGDSIGTGGVGTAWDWAVSRV